MGERTSEESRVKVGLDECGTITKAMDFKNGTDKGDVPSSTSSFVMKGKRIGHRRIESTGTVTYKKIDTNQIIGSVQLGIQHAVDQLTTTPDRDLLMKDFMSVEITKFTSHGSVETPAHLYPEFTFKTYAPIAFRYFRDLFLIRSDDFLKSFTDKSLSQLSNPGASGSVFFLTHDDEFIVKTVQHKEGEFLQTLLPGYYMNLNQNPQTLLPKFFGLYCYKYNLKNIRLLVMNNLLPSSAALCQKYDLKGSTYKRKASESEKNKKHPTYKDLDFLQHHPEGLFLRSETYNTLIKTLQRDCRVLESFRIIDYSLLVGIYKIENQSDDVRFQKVDLRKLALPKLSKIQPLHPQAPSGGILGKNSKGEDLAIFIGIIDILQSYRFHKQLEHAWKSVWQDRDSVSVHNPRFYSKRFQEFVAEKVFRKIPTTRKLHSPGKQKMSVQSPPKVTSPPVCLKETFYGEGPSSHSKQLVFQSGTVPLGAKELMRSTKAEEPPPDNSRQGDADFVENSKETSISEEPNRTFVNI